MADTRGAGTNSGCKVGIFSPQKYSVPKEFGRREKLNITSVIDGYHGRRLDWFLRGRSKRAVVSSMQLKTVQKVSAKSESGVTI